METTKEILREARNRAREIARQTKNTPKGYYPAFYEGERGYVVSAIQNGWETRTRTIRFWRDMTKKQVLARIDEYEKETTFLEEHGY